MKQIIANLTALGTKRLIVLGATGLAIVLALMVGLSAVLAPVWRPIATDLSASEGADMLRALEQAGYQPKISGDGTLISLPEDQIARARMALAEAGLAAEGLPGWELFDDQSAIGMNTFLQRVNRLRALEGELARSVQTIDVVEAARVHLVLPEREAFSADRPEPSAAVIIRTRRGMTFERSQALAVRSLVAAALPGLAPERVTVLSATGDTILASDSEGGDSAGATHAARIAIEERLARNIEQILGPRVGAGNVRVRVAAELATAREVIQRETFDPDSSAPRQVRSVSESSDSRSGGNQSVDVLNNIPDGNATASGDNRSDARSRSEDETRFEIGSTRTETIVEPGGLRRLSVAVLVNGRYEEGTYTDRPTEEIERLTALVRSTMGFDESRGDALTVESLRFVEDGALYMPEVETSVADTLVGHLPGLLRWGIALLIVLVVVLLAVRPALKRVFSPRDADGNLLGAGRDEANAETIEPGEDAAGAEIAPPEEEKVALVSVRGPVAKARLEDLGRLVETEKDASLRQIRLWLNQKS